MFASSPIRYLARSEEIFAHAQNFIGIKLHLSGRLDVMALSEAFDTLLQVHPVLTGHLEPAGDDSRNRSRRGESALWCAHR